MYSECLNIKIFCDLFVRENRHCEYVLTFLNTKVPKEKLASGINPNKRARNDSTILWANLSKLNDLLDSISSDETSFKQAMALILNKDVFKNAIAGVFVPEVTTLCRQVITLKSKVHGMEQYTRPN